MFKTILIPVDGSLSMERLVHQSLQFASEVRARVIALHVLGEGNHEHSLISSPASEESGPDVSRARLILQEVADTAGGRGVQCDGQLLVCSEPWRAIVQAAVANDVDLICMASHGRHGSCEHLLPSQTSGVIEHTRVPVLLFR